MGSKCNFKTVQNIMTNTLVSFTFAIERFFVFVCFTVIKAPIEPLTQFTLFLPFVTLISTFIYLKWMTATFRLRQIVFHFSSDRISKDMPFNTYCVRVFELSSLFLSFCRRHAIQYEANRMDFFLLSSLLYLRAKAQFSFLEPCWWLRLQFFRLSNFKWHIFWSLPLTRPGFWMVINPPSNFKGKPTNFTSIYSTAKMYKWIDDSLDKNSLVLLK